MTDYIEMVLEEQEDEREGSLSQSFGLPAPSEWGPWGGREVSPSVAMRQLPRQREPTQVQENEQEHSLGQPFGLPAPSGRELLNGDVGRGFSPSVATRQLPRQRELALLGDFLSPADGGTAPAEREPRAEGLRARLRRAEAAAGYRGETAAMEVREEWSGNRGRSVLELDAAFSRDARRYDNGFELF